MREWLRLHSIEIRIFFTVWFIYALHFTPAGGVTPNRYMNLVHSIVNEGRFEIDTYHENTDDKAYYDGHYYAGALPGPAFLAVPPYVVFKGFYTLLPDSIKALAGNFESYKKGELSESSFYGEVDNVEYFLSQGFVVIFSLAVFAALVVVLFYKIVCLFGLDFNKSIWLTFGLAFGTILFWHATTLFEQVYNVFFGISSFYVLLQMRVRGKFTNSGILLAGLLAGSGFLVEFSGAFTAAVIFFYLLAVYRHPRAFLYCLTCAIPVLILMAYNYSLFDNPFSTPYQHLAGQSYQGIVREGFIGVSFPRLDRLLGLLFSPERGIFVFSPILILGFAGLFIRVPSNSQFLAEIWVCRVMTAISLLYVSSFAGWNAGGAFGPRYTMFGLAFMLLPAILVISKVPFTFVTGVTLVSILVNWAGAQRGFAETYYQHINSLIVQGPTLPALLVFQTHLSASNDTLKWVGAQQGWLTMILLFGVLLICWAVWGFPKPVRLSQSNSEPVVKL